MLFELMRQNIGTEDPDPDWLRDTPQWESRLHRWFPLWNLADSDALKSHR